LNLTATYKQQVEKERLLYAVGPKTLGILRNVCATKKTGEHFHTSLSVKGKEDSRRFAFLTKKNYSNYGEERH
jgi:hypothetical protein